MPKKVLDSDAEYQVRLASGSIIKAFPTERKEAAEQLAREAKSSLFYVTVSETEIVLEDEDDS